MRTLSLSKNRKYKNEMRDFGIFLSFLVKRKLNSFLKLAMICDYLRGPEEFFWVFGPDWKQIHMNWKTHVN